MKYSSLNALKNSALRLGEDVLAKFNASKYFRDEDLDLELEDLLDNESEEEFSGFFSNAE